MADNALRVNPADNVAVAVAELKKGDKLSGAGLGEVTLAMDVPRNHKVALVAIARGEKVIKYGEPIGVASADIAPGDWVHVDNLKEAEE